MDDLQLIDQALFDVQQQFSPIAAKENNFIDRKCFICNKEINSGKSVTVDDKPCHNECFRCSGCNLVFGLENRYIEIEKQHYCEKCYDQKFAPKCAQCNGPIKGKMLKAIDKDWHPEHFNCVKCGCCFNDPEDTYAVHENQPYCTKDFRDLFLKKCFGCNQSIETRIIRALEKDWHDSCFVCSECKRVLEAKYFSLNDKPYCEDHIRAARGLVCNKCKKTLDGEYCNIGGSKYHKECFVCFECGLTITGKFRNTNGNYFCQNHQEKPNEKEEKLPYNTEKKN